MPNEPRVYLRTSAVTRTKSTGVVKVVFNISTKGMEKCGYTVRDAGTRSAIRQS